MLKVESNRNDREMPKRLTPAVEISEASSLKYKKTSSLTTCSALHGKTAEKDLLTKNQSPKRQNGEQCGYQNGSPKKGVHDPKGKLAGSTRVERSSRKGPRRGNNYLGNCSTSELHFASSSSTATQKEAKVNPDLGAQCAKLRISSDDVENIPLYDDGDTSSSEETLSENLQALKVEKDDAEGVEPLLPELMDDIIGRLPMLEVLQLRSKLGKLFKDAIHRPAFRPSRPDAEGEFSPSFFTTDDEGDLHWYGFGTKLRKWARLPSLNFAKIILPSPDPDLFKDYLVAGDGGLLCINVGKATGREKLVICNPLTQQVRVLPPLKHPRHPVLMHLKVDHDSGHYKIIVAGSSAIGTDEISLKTEVYDSRYGVWECPDGSDMPCPVFGLNEYQNGVYFKDLGREFLMCIAILDTKERGVLVYDITNEEWAQDPHAKQLHIPLVRSTPIVAHLATTQIVECGRSVFVFSEQDCGKDVYFLIHKLVPDGSGNFLWDEVMKRKWTGGRGLLVYPEFTCAPVSEHELCIFNTVEHAIEIIINLVDNTEVTPLQSPTSMGNRFHSLNPIGFVFRPSFKSSVYPSGRTLKVKQFRNKCERKDSNSICSSIYVKDDFKTTDSSASFENSQSNPVN